ncbi:hypothetical protein NXW41_25010 [Bacteroides thetaiotaomicron]|nr:hypothetical protein [Bacteroides thetaiotaomicron]MCS3001409.1 hypothetical protein [Bacteroides thetaiotaomicron]
MSSSMLEQRSRFAMIGALMIIISLMFWYYMGVRWLVLQRSTSNRYRQ